MITRLTKLGLLSLGFALPATALTPGDPVTVDAIANAEFVKGEAPASWARDELYIFECWATWCGPCIAAIPHVDRLYDKFHAQGLNVYGMNVFEDGKEKVVKFVNNKGDGMSYPVAYVGRGGRFDEAWLKPAGVNTIPHAFVVKNGELLFSMHPASLSEEIIAGLLAGGEKEAAFVNGVRKQAADQAAMTVTVKDFNAALEANNTASMRAAYEAAKELSPEPGVLTAMKLDIAVAEGNWPEAETTLASLGDSTQAIHAARRQGLALDTSNEKIPADFLHAIIARLEPAKSAHFLHAPIVARLQWALGEKDLARATAQQAAEAKSLIPKTVWTDFAESFTTDQPQTMQAFRQAVTVAMKKRAEAINAAKQR